jgi:proteasome accessory factor B
MSRVERLLNLTAALLAASHPITAEEINGTIPGYPPDRASFKRQFERDKEALRSLGMAIETVALSPAVVGYRISTDGYYLRDPGLDPGELAALQLAARTVALDGFGAADAMWKLSGAAGDADVAVIDGALASAAVPASPVLPALFDAITESRIAEFSYRNEARRTAPRSLAFRNGHWYLDAYDLLRADDRSFRVDRIDGAVTIGDAVSPPPRSRAADQQARLPWELGDGNAFEAIVRIDAEQAPWAVRYLGSQRVVATEPDGAVTVRLDVVNTDAATSFVLGFLDAAEILSPASFRDAFIADVTNTATRFAAPTGAP